MKLNRNKMAMLMIAIMVTSVVMTMASAQVTVLDNPPDMPVKVKGDVTYANGTRVPDGWLVTLTDVTEGTELGNDTTEDKIPAIPQYEILVVPPTLIIEGHVIKASVSNGEWSGNTTHPVQSGETAPGSKITMDDIVVHTVEPTTPDIVINEFMSNNDTEWVELYNKGTSSVDLTDWTLEDEAGHSKSLSAQGTIEAQGYQVYTCASGWLNNDEDIIWLNSTTENIDKVGYGTSGGAPAPDAGKSTGRYPNGVDTGNDTADFTEFDVPTPGAANVIEQVLTTIEVSPSTATLNVNTTEQFTATAKDQNGNVMSGVVINWTSSNVTVGTITDAGLLTALVVGTTTVMAANGTVNGTAAVTVQSGVQPVLTTIEVSPSTATVNVNATKQFNATAKDQDGNVMSGVVINWTSSNVTVGTITDAGLLTALVVGTTTVTAANETVNGTAAVTVQEVVPQNLTTIEVTPATATLGVNVEKAFNATAKDQDGNVMPDVVIAWTSSNGTVGTVSPASAITGDDGTAKTTLTTIAVGTATVTAANGTVNDTACVTVQITPLNIADLKAEPSKYVNTANPTKVSAKITSGAGLELVTLYAMDTKNYQPKQYTLYAEDIPIGGDDYSSEWDATEFKVKGETTSSGTKPVFVGKTDKWVTTTYYSVLGNLTINATSGTAVAVALFNTGDLKLSELIDPLTKESYSVESGNTTFAPFAVDATNRDSITDIWALLGSLEPLDAVTLTGTAPDYSISLVKTQVPDGDYTVGMAALDKAGDKDYNETTVSVGLKPTPTPAPSGRGGGGGGGVPDTDGDGYTDIEEMIMGTDPLDPCDPNPECVACTGAMVEEAITEVITERPATPKPKPALKPTPAPTTPEPKPEEPEKPPGFEAVFAIAGLLAVAYMALRRKK